MKRIIYIPILLLVLSSFAQAQSYTRTETRQFPAEGDISLAVHSEFGRVVVTGSQTKTVDIKAVIKITADSESEAKRIAEKDVEFETEASGSQITVRSRLTGKQHKNQNRDIDIDIQISVPHQTMLRLNNKFGNSKVLKLRNGADVESEFGSVEIQDCANVKVTNAFGGTNVVNPDGPISVTGKHGKVYCSNIQGGTIRNEFGEVSLHTSSAPVMIFNRMGRITAKQYPGGNIRSEYGAVEVKLTKDFAGEVYLETEFGGIDTNFEIEEKKKTTSSTARGQIGSGNGSLKVTNKFGSIDVEK